MRRKFIQRWSTIQPLNSNHCTQRGMPDFSVLDESNSINASWALNLISTLYPMLLGVLLLSVPMLLGVLLLSVLSSLNLYYVCSHICIIILCFDLNYFFCLIFLWNRVYCVCVSIAWILSKWVNWLLKRQIWIVQTGWTWMVHTSTKAHTILIYRLVTFMHAYIYICVRHLQWRQLFLECYVYRHRLLMICTFSP
jgi:hypothetical protein